MKITGKCIATVAAVLIILGLISCGSDAKAVPNVTGMEYSKALNTLSQAGFHSVSGQDANGQASVMGTVSKQEPKAGENVSTTTKVVLTFGTANATSAPQYSKAEAQALVGKGGAEAIAELESKGVMGSVTIENDLEPGADRIQQVKDDTASGVPYVVTAATYHRLTSGKVDLTVDTVTHQASKKRSEVDGSTATAVVAACNQAGQQRFPFGYDPESIMGVLQAPMRKDDGMYFYKLQAKVKNQYNVKQKVTVECTTSGDQSNMTVTGFNAY